MKKNRLIKIIILFIAFGITSCNYHENEPLTKTNLIMKTHSDSLEFFFIKLCNQSGSKGTYYLKKYDAYKDASKEIRKIVKNEQNFKKKNLITAVSNYIIAVEETPLQSEKFFNTKRTIIMLFNNSPVNQLSIINTYLISNTFLINCFLTDFHLDDYKFDFAKVEVEPSKKHYNLNDSIEFKIYLKAYNSYLNNKVLISRRIDNEDIKYAYDTLTAFENAKSGDFIYKTKLIHKGKNEFSGKYFYLESEIPFNFEYYVK